MANDLFVANERWGDYWHDRFHYHWEIAQTSYECPRWKGWPESVDPPYIDIEDFSVTHTWLTDAFLWKSDNSPDGWINGEERAAFDEYDEFYTPRFPWRQLTRSHLLQISKRVIGR